MSDFSPDALKDLAPAYALGLLEGDELAAFERALAQDAALVRDVAEFRETAGLLGSAAPQAVPAASLRARVLATTPTGAGASKSTAARAATTAASTAASPRTAEVLPFRARPDASATNDARPGLVWWGTLAASVALLAVSALQLRSAKTELAALRTEATAAKAAADSIARQLAARETELNSILEPNVQLVRLTPGGADQAIIQLFVNPASGKVILHAFHLPPTEKGKRYQLWFVRKGGAPMPSVLFDTESSGHGLVQSIDLPPGELPALAAVTIEPDGGSPAPTTPILLSGALSR